ncbi:TPA: hypothetical protein ACH3X2_000459 [Trebouxia sp. C0005]
MPQFPLSSDLLVRIFARIKPQPPSISYRTTARSDETFRSKYINFNRLRLVCKQFKEAFDKDSHNSDHLLLHQGFSSKSLLGLLDWLQRNKLAVRSFEANCGEAYIELALGALASPESILRKVCLISTTAPAVELLSSFRSITSCILALERFAEIDLQPFQSLQGLKELHLQRAGLFSSLHAAHHLTSLLITDTVAESKHDCPCVFSLLDLQVKNSQLRGLHSSGLSACTGLQDLTLGSCLIEAQQADDEVNLISHNIPSSITALTQLTHLSVQIDYRHSGLPCDMSWMYSLNSLQCLEVSIAQSAHKVPVSNQLCRLSHLTKLDLSGQNLGADQTCFSLQVVWFLMRNLQVLSFRHCTVVLSLVSDMNPHLSLLFAPALSTLSFHDCKPDSGYDVQNFALWIAMSASRPMQILVDGENFSAQIETARRTYAALPELYELAENGQLSDQIIS